MKIKDLLQLTTGQLRQAGIEEAPLEAELLLRSFLGLSRVAMHLSDETISPGRLASFADLVARRLRHEPLAYILGEQEFWSLPFVVSRQVLIPRPETELLIEEVLKRIAEPLTFAGEILDLGSGSGIIPVVLALELPRARLTGVDISAAVLQVATANASRHGVDHRITWHQGDWFDGLTPADRFSFILSNPPYVAEACRSQLQPELAFEPENALFAGPEGMDELRRIIVRCAAFLAAGGWFLTEIGYDQGAAVRALLSEQHAFDTVEVVRDLAGHDRLVMAQKTLLGRPGK